MSPFRALAVLLFAALVAAPDALAQTGLQKYNLWCAGCHGNAGNDKDGVLGGKDWNIIKLAMDTKPEMTADLRPAYNAGLLTDADFMLIASYLATVGGGVTSQLSMPAPENFGSLAVGVGSPVVTKTVNSIGNAAVQLSSVSSTNPLEFVIVPGGTCTAGAFVNPVSSCTIKLQFTPAATGARSGQITVASNGVGSPQSFAVSGTGGAGGGGTPALMMPSAQNFGTVNVGASSGVSVKTINSTGTATAQITTVASSNPAEFQIVSRTCTDGAAVNAGSSCTVSVQFAPAAAGARNGQITVTSNGTGSPQSFAVSGTGQSVAPPPSGLTVPSSLNLGSQAVGVQSAGSVLSVSNAGASAVTVTNVQTSSNTEFPIVGITCSTVAAGGNCSVTVAFKPLAAGARSGTLTLTDTGTGSPHTVTLSGTGTSVGGGGANKIPVVEYFNAAFGHYFMTAQTDEIVGLDGGAFNFAFVRTGLGFNAWDAQAAGTVPVCRFFTTPGNFGTKSSHFYTADAAECDFVKLNPNWQYEKIAFYTQVPTAGVCPGGTLPVYRAFNNGQTGAPNHRFTTDFALYQQFTTVLGWGAEGIKFCTPP